MAVVMSDIRQVKKTLKRLEEFKFVGVGCTISSL